MIKAQTFISLLKAFALDLYLSVCVCLRAQIKRAIRLAAYLDSACLLSCVLSPTN